MSNSLADLGDVHHGRKKVQPSGRVVREFYEKAAPLLRHPLLTFDERARSEIAAAFESELAKQTYTCWACAVMPDHVHILIRKHKHLAEEMAENLMHASRDRLIETGHRDNDHPAWTAGTGWKVFLGPPGRDSPDHPLHRAEPREDPTAGTAVAVRETVRQLAIP